ncbi:MAG: hypothetical protein RIT43_2362 [Bacteroidota bacterium]
MAETASSKLSVTIVGMMTNDKAKVLFTAPSPTAAPPKHPTMVTRTQTIPKR